MLPCSFTSSIYVGGISKVWTQKNHRIKIDNIYSNFEPYQVFIHNFLSQTVFIFSTYILLRRRIDTFWSERIGKFWPGNIRKIFWTQKDFDYIKAPCTTFCTKMPVYSHCIYCLEKKLKHFGQQILGWNYQQSLNRQNHTRKILKIYQDFESKSPSIIFCLQCQYYHYLYCLQEESFEVLFINQRWFHFFFHIIWHIPILPSCRVPCCRH